MLNVESSISLCLDNKAERCKEQKEKQLTASNWDTMRCKRIVRNADS